MIQRWQNTHSKICRCWWQSLFICGICLSEDYHLVICYLMWQRHRYLKTSQGDGFSWLPSWWFFLTSKFLSSHVEKVVFSCLHGFKNVLDSHVYKVLSWLPDQRFFLTSRLTGSLDPQVKIFPLTPRKPPDYIFSFTPRFKGFFLNSQVKLFPLIPFFFSWVPGWWKKNLDCCISSGAGLCCFGKTFYLTPR